MRPLLLISSIILIAASVSCCQSKRASADDAAPKTEGTNGNSRGERTNPHEASPNTAPDQGRIDSLKYEKLQDKFDE